MDAEDWKRAKALARKIEHIANPSIPEMYQIWTRTALENKNSLLNWAFHMDEHEARTKNRHERVYLVVSELRLVTKSRRSSSKEKGQNTTSTQRTSCFLLRKDIKVLHEKHWALEINGRYYELTTDEDGSDFLFGELVGESNRRITARIFIGTTHCEHRALKEIGTAVISTQINYELTRDNCQRFVRVFLALALCPNHTADTIPDLPSAVEEIIATKGLNQITGYSGIQFDRNFNEGRLHRASRLMGEGVEWTIEHDDHISELRRTKRKLKQKSDGIKDSGVKYYDAFFVHQEQTSYFLEHDMELVDRVQQCQTLGRSPFLSLARFDKNIKYSIIPTLDGEDYRPKGYANGNFFGPCGVTWSEGSFKKLYPVEIIRDHWNIWRDGDGQRLEQPKSTLRLVIGKLEDFFGRASRKRFSYRLPARELIGLKSRSY